MTNRRYEVIRVEPCEHGWLSGHGSCFGAERTRLSSIPDDLLEEAAQLAYEESSLALPWHLQRPSRQDTFRDYARAALSVLFPDGEEE